MSYNIENRQHEYTQARRRVEKMYPGARLKVNENAGFFIESTEGRNIIALRYPNMAFTDNMQEIESNISICCAVTMEPDEVLELIDKLKLIIKQGENDE